MTGDIDPERKFSNGSDWNNSIDWDDASDGSDGGYNIHGSPINAEAMKELIQLRMTNARLREAVKNAYYEGWQDNADAYDTADKLHKDWEFSEARLFYALDNAAKETK